MSLTNVLLIHVSSRYMPRNEKEELQEQNNEYYNLLELPKYAPICEIRKAYRRITLKIQCDRMMLEWNAPGDNLAATQALQEQETLVKEAFHILGDKHLRQQYHLLQCRPSRYKMIKGPLAVIHGLTQSRRWFPLLVLQSVIVATMVNAVVAEYRTQEWVYVLIPAFGYYGLIALFWLYMQEFPWRRHCTMHSFAAMLSASFQHVCLWNGCFWMARYWDRDTGPNITWYILSIPFYLAIFFRCHCTLAAVASLRHLQSKMISRDYLQHVETQQQSAAFSNDEPPHKDGNDLPEGYIVVTQDSALFTSRLMNLSMSGDDVEDLNLIETAKVETSPEHRQVEHAAKTLRRSAIQLVTLGTLFVILVSLKLEDHFDVTWWLIFAPVWIYFGIRLFEVSRAPKRVPAGSTSPGTTTTVNNTNANNIMEPSSNLNASPSSTEGPASSTGGPSSTEGPSSKLTSDESEEADIEAALDTTMDVASKSLWKGEYTAVDVAMDISTQSTSHEDTRDAEKASVASSAQLDNLEMEYGTVDAATKDPEQSLVDSVHLLTADERDVEAAIPPTPTTNDSDVSAQPDDDISPLISATTAETTATTNNDSTNETSPEGGPAVHEEFERWQSVYENQETRSGTFQFIPCQLFFQIMIVLLIVAKLDESYENTSPEGSAFNAFYILLVPFSVGLIVCCCALLAGFIALNTEAPPASGDTNLDGTSGDNTNAPWGANGDSDELAPMQAGAKEPQQKTFAAHLDVPRPDLTFPQRVQVLTAALSISTTEAETWLVENDATFLRGSKTLWEQVVNCAHGLQCETVSQDENIVEIESFDKECIVLLRTNLQAHFEKTKFETELNAIEPADDDENDAGGIECPVCCEDYDIKDMVHCEGNPIHFFCRICFHRYATETVQAGDVAGMPCADAGCEATFATPTVTSNLSQWELLRQRDRENERNEKVALAAKAVLQCTCGAVGIVTEDAVGDGCIHCPGDGCDKQFCALCGNNWHPETSCPPTKKMLQWVVQNTMPCPNCHTPIEKNLGCDHMYCAPPGGCGHHFSYRTGKPMSKHGRNLRGLYH